MKHGWGRIVPAAQWRISDPDCKRFTEAASGKKICDY